MRIKKFYYIGYVANVYFFTKRALAILVCNKALNKFVLKIGDDKLD